jgi:hypothetical protein
MASIPTTSPTIQNLPITNLGTLATNNILWNTTSDFTNYASNNSTIESGQLSLQEVNIAYDFTDDSNGADPSGWYLFEYPNTYIDVINDLNGHSKVVKIFDNASIGLLWMTQYFDEQISGKVEFWLQTASDWSGDRVFVTLAYTNEYPNATGMGSPAVLLDIRDDGTLYIWNDSSNTQLANWTDDTWHHFLVDFNCTSAAVEVWLDGVSTGQYGFYSYFSYNYVNQITIYSAPDAMTGSFYLDAVDYSWTSGYFINRSYNYYGQKYYTSCMWVSTVQDLGVSKPYYNNLTFSGQTSANTSISISYRESPNNVGWDLWSAWTTSNISFNKDGKRYIQIRILLTTNDALQTPVLDWINFCYTI